jgi:phosphatidylglycerol lysyltransferase
LIYSGIALFRPVVYRFRTLPQERSLATRLVERYGRSQLDFFKCWPDKSYFFSPNRDCFIAYRVALNYAIALADPVGPERKTSDAIQEFKHFCDENDWGISFYQTLPDFLNIYSQVGLKKLKIGDAAIVDLKSFPPNDRRMHRIWHKNEKLEKAGLHVRVVDPPIPDLIMKQVKEVSDEWLRIPGRRERGFTLGRFNPDYIRSTALFLVLDGTDRLLSFVNIVPSYRKAETTIDLMRHRVEAPNGSMDYLFTKLFIRSRELGFQRFNFGMAPMSGFRESEEASIEERAVHYFFQHLNFLFSFSGMHHYKQKFATSWEPRYLIYRRVLDLPLIAVALSKLSGLEHPSADLLHF